MNANIRLILLSFAFTIPFWNTGCGKRDIMPGTMVSIVYSGDTRGRLEGYGCDRIEGGMTKRSARIADLRMTDPEILYLDAGNFLTGTPEVDQTRGLLMVAAYNRLGASIVNIGERELVNGIESFNAAKDESEFEYVSANIRHNGHLIADPFIVRTVHGVRVAVVGLCGTKRIMNYDTLMLPEGIVIDSPLQTAQKIVPSLADKSDIVVLLSSCGDAADSAIAGTVPGIHLVIGGRSYRPNADKPWIVEETRIVRAQHDGRSLGRMDMVLGENAKVETFSPSKLDLRASDRSDEQMLSLIRDIIPSFVDNSTDGVRIRRE